jgi:diaminohydroxyphosphoribosylaminopyrimidine deaminase/5-amino-6-(5-phosphoribosylamino)uracil reductase
MEQALALAALGEGTTSPNPRVGCVIVRDGQVVGRGFHRAAGEPHAEALAIRDAGELARGATLYVNLEPCVHHGRTPPCADRVVKSGVGRVVASITDPNPLVNGKGFAILREAGIQVDTGLLEQPARWLNRTFLHWHVAGRPWVTLKAAVSVDGMLSALGGESKWITGPVARRFAHRLRFRHDAVLVGAGTVRRDDPRLTIRLEGTSAPRLRVVLSTDLGIDPSSRILDRNGAGSVTRVYTSTEVDARRAATIAAKAEVRRVPLVDGKLDLLHVLSDLGHDGIQSVLVEGGAQTFASFLEGELAQEAAVFTAPRVIGARGGTPMVDGQAASRPTMGWRLSPVQGVPLGVDLLVLGRLEREAGSGTARGER